MARSTIRLGSQGPDTEDLQIALNKQGHNLAVDGIFGPKTKKALTSFQNANGLEADGIAGEKTWSLIDTINGVTGKIKDVVGKVKDTVGNIGNKIKDFVTSDSENGTDTGYQPGTYTESDELGAVKDKVGAYEDQVTNWKPTDWDKSQDWTDLYEKIMGREDFNYDFNTDALYQQYKDKYIQQGKMAMADTIGQASAMTGGYGNSYAATAGSQAYQASLQNLNDMIPELYQMALDKYNQKGQEMYKQAGLLMDDYDRWYGENQDSYNKLINERGYYSDKAASMSTDEYNRYLDQEDVKYTTHRDTVEDEQWQKTYDLDERQVAMQEEAWELEKKSYENDDGGNNSGGNNSGGNDSGGDDDTPINPTSTKNTTGFINSHKTQQEFLSRGGTYSKWLDYIEGEIEKVEDSLSDEEIVYLINHYGLSGDDASRKLKAIANDVAAVFVPRMTAPYTIGQEYMMQ